MKKRRVLAFPGILFLLPMFLLLAACEGEQAAEKPGFYKGPKSEVEGMEMIMTDSAKLNVRMTAPLQTELQNGDRHFPKGVFIEFYNKQGIKTTTLRADKGFKLQLNNVHTAQGNVVVVNLEKNQTLRTELLNWNPDTKKLYTDKFVTITTPDEVLKGTGLDAAQDLSSYNIRKISGVFAVEK